MNITAWINVLILLLNISLKGKKNCENSCTDFKKHFYNPNNNECLDTCKGLPNLEFVNQITSSSPSNPCKKQCDDPDDNSDVNVYYDFDSNICITKCGENNPKYIYHTTSGKMCYPSCTDIPGGSYVYESSETETDGSKICYDSKPTGNTCNYYYMKKDGTLECLGNTPNKCKEINYNYLLGQECKTDCNDYFILEDDTSLEGFIKCFETRDNCLASGGGQADYYNTKLKKCWKNYPDGYYINKTEGTKYEIVQECKHFYYKDTSNNKFYCVDKCSSSSYPYFVRGQKNCEASCITFSKSYFDITNGEDECLDTCIGRVNEFADVITDLNSNQVQQCKLECGNTGNIHYNYGTKICLANCGDDKFFKSDDSNKIICYSSCAEIPGEKNIYESVTNNICYTKNEVDVSPPLTDCPSYYYPRNDGTMKCMASGTTCKANGFDYLYGKECKKNCDNFYIIMDEKDAAGVNLLNTKQCFKDLQDALSSGKSSTGYFYDLNEKKVWLNYDSNLYIKYKNGANYEVVQNWQDYYYEESSMNFIVTNCKTVSLYFENDNKKCLSSCTNYFDPTNNECLDSCKKTINLEYADPAATDPKKCINKCPKYFIRKVYGANNIQINECVQTCPASDPTYKFIDVKTNECKTACGSNQYEVTIDNIKYCYPECDVSNGNIYINTDTYDCVKVCPSSLKQFELIKTLDNGKKIYLCKSICKQDEFRYRDECVKKCPNNFNHIGFNGICKESCTEDPNGESFYPVETVTIPTDSGSTTYTIYKCINSCEQAIEANTGITTPYTFYTELNPKECLSACPASGYTHNLNSNLYECLANCPDNFPFYGADNKCVSNNVCTGSNLFFDNGQCYGSCQGGKIYYDEKKFCLDECREGEIKQSNGDGTFTCKAVCEKYIYQENSETEPECVPNCKEDKNYVGKNNICKKSCETEDGINYYELALSSEDPPITYKIFKCVDGCKDDYDHFKYREANNGKQCYKSCSSTNGYPYLSEEENLCYSNCLDSIKYPFTLEKKDTNGIIISQKCLQECDTSSDYKYYGKNKKCIKKCDELPEEKLIEYDGIKCVEKCTNPDYLFELRGKCAH
jgi:hypothetical protein